jgi:L-iditol 2-dehydrogenase
MTIRAAVMTAPRAPIVVRELDDPVLEQGSLLLETIASEVCGTDVHLHHGRLEGVPYPIVPGHVSVGRVVDARGLEADALGEPLRVGDVVTFYDVHEVCNACYHCTVAQQPNRCPSRRVYGITYSANEGPLGGWAERIHLKPGVRVLRIPEALDADDVIGGGCGLFTGFAAVERSDLTMGDVVVVQGAGPVGLAAAAFASLRGAVNVMVIGAPQSRLDLALRLGADQVLPLEMPIRERADVVRAVTGGRGADVIVEASGNPDAIREGLDLLRDGGTYVVGGHYTDTGSVELNPHLHINRRHANILGQWGTDFRHIVRALALLAKHRERLPFRDVIGARYGLDHADRALADVAALRVTKAVIDPTL